MRNPDAGSARIGRGFRRVRIEIPSRRTSYPVKTNFQSAAFIFNILLAGSLWAQTAGQTQTIPKATPPPQVAASAAKAAEQEEIPPAGPNALYPAVVARVNGKAVLGRDLEQRVRAELATIGNPAWKDLREDYKVDVTTRNLSLLVGDELIYQKATAGGVAVTPEEVQAEFDKVAKTYPSDAALNVELANRGMDRKALSLALARDLVISKYVQENITKKLVVTPVEVAEYYKAHPDDFRHPDLIRTSHVLINVPAGVTAEQEKALGIRAEAILERARKGEDFAKLAKENSMDPSASRGGDIGLTQKGELEAAYEDAAEKLKVGEVSGIVRTSYGFHIIKLTDRKKAGIASLDEVRAELTDFLKAQKEDVELEKLIKTLQSQAQIDILVKSTSH
ncbi:MAG: PpiC-type peptidyl-prolyl cis-trans isomerase [Acidobacteria bacterium]|nr:PpiC-type peptidyl-prolyl cis-trans isomerase [Acidobacteriota bacterium]